MGFTRSLLPMSMIKLNNLSVLRPRSVFIALLFIVSIIFAFIIPPFQKPDEQIHFWKIMALAQGKLTCIHTSDIPVYQLSNSIKAFPEEMHRADIIMRSAAKFPLSVYKSPYPFRNDTTRTNISDACALPTLGYIPFVLSAWISFPFDNLLVTFFGIRAMAALLFLIAVSISFRVVHPRFRFLVYLFAATPMVIHQATAVSYDAPLLYGVLISFAWFTSLMERRVSVGAFFGFTACILITTLTKPGYIFLYILPIVVLGRLISFRNSAARIVASVLGIAAAITAVYGLDLFIKHNLFRTQMQVYVMDKLYFFRQVAATLGENSDAYLRGMVGVLGWLDTVLPPFLYVVYWVVLGVLFVKTVRFHYKPSRAITGVLLIGMCIVNIVVLFFRFAISGGTPAAYAVIYGMQGRYLLPFLPFILYGASLIVSALAGSKLKYVVLVCCGIIAVISLGGIFYERYFDYAMTYKNPRYFEIQLFEKPTIDIKTLQSYTIDKTMTYEITPLYPNYKVGGFQFIMGNELDVTTPYQYRIVDKNCTRVVREGFLDRLKTPALSFLKGPTDIVYTQTFPITKMEGTTYCVTLSPVMHNNRTYLEILGNEKSPLIELLYIQQ